MKFKTSDITYMSFSIILLITGGFFLYYMSLVFPVPGSKFIIMSAYLSLVLFFPIKKIQKIGVMSLISIIFGLILSIFTLFMGISIILTGILADITTLIFLRNYNTNKKIILSASFYPLYAYITSIYITNFVTGNLLYNIVELPIFILVGLIIFILGIIGSFIGYKINIRITK